MNDEKTADVLKRKRSLEGVLNDALSYDREPLEGRLWELGARWGDVGEAKFTTELDDLECLSGAHPGKLVTAHFRDGQLRRFTVR